MSNSGKFGRRLCATIPTALWLLLCGRGQVLAQSGAWTTKAPMPTSRCCLAVEADAGFMYTFGGEMPTGGPNIVFGTVEVYDSQTNAWVSKAPMPTPRYYTGAAVIDSKIYVLGGLDSANHATPILEAFDPKTNTWTSKPMMPTPRAAMSVAVVDGVLYAIGGVTLGPDEFFGVVEAYDPKTNVWTTKAPMHLQRGWMASGVLDGLMYVVGGERRLGFSGRERLATLDIYDPRTDTWSLGPPMPTARAGAAGTMVDRKLFVVGGFDGQLESVHTVVESYDPESNLWEAQVRIPTARVFSGAGVLDDTLYVVGGYPGLSVNEAFSPFLHVGIDLKPGDAKNTISFKSAGTVAVAILGSATFDPLTVDPATVTLAGVHPTTPGRGLPMTHTRDVNRDGYLDLVLYFRIRDLKLTPTDTQAVMYGTTFSGQRIRGSDSVRLVPFQLPASATRDTKPTQSSSRFRRIPR